MRYVSTTLPGQDAKVAAKLCIGGPVRYAPCDGSNITDAWMLQNVVPHIAQRFSAHFALTLAPPIIWACYDDHITIPVPDFLKNRVRQAYQQIRNPNLPVEQNPIAKHQLIVSNDNGALSIVEAGTLANLNNQQNDTNGLILQLEQVL